MGVHVLDVLVRPVEAIPEGQGGQLVEQIKVTAGGLRRRRRRSCSRSSARRSAARARSAPTPPATCCSTLLRARRRRHLAAAAPRRRPDVRERAADPARTARARRSTSSARTRTYGPDDVDGTRSATATHLHLGGPEFMGGEAAAEILALRARARRHDLGRHPRAGRPGRCSTGSRRRSSTSTTCCPTTSRCSASPARTTSSRAPAR